MLKYVQAFCSLLESNIIQIISNAFLQFFISILFSFNLLYQLYKSYNLLDKFSNQLQSIKCLSTYKFEFFLWINVE